MPVIEKMAADEVGKKGTGCIFFTQALEIAIELQRGNGIVAVQPRPENAHEQQKRIGVLIAGDFPVTEFDLMNCRLDALLGKSLPGAFFEGRKNELFDLFGGFRVRSLQPGGKVGFAIIVVKTGAGS